MTISERIFELLKKKNMTQKQFAHMTGITEAAISDWKKKGTNPSSEKILRICEVLEVSPNYLLLGAESKNRAIRPVEYAVFADGFEKPVVIENQHVVDPSDRLDAYCRQFGYRLGDKSRDNCGSYLNPGIGYFTRVVNSMYVDKTRMLELLNDRVELSGNCYLCVSRPRRFGKTIAGSMIAAYYGYKSNSRELFDHMNISDCKSYHKHLNKYDVIYLDMQGFQTRENLSDAGIGELEKNIIREVYEQYLDILGSYEESSTRLTDVLLKVYSATRRKFVVLIDEWDSIFRNEPENDAAHSFYINWLRNMFKDYKMQDVYALVYMTGIFPIRRYGTESALNNFDEISFLDTGDFAEYTGFTDQEVQMLCDEYNIDFDLMKQWYDGYKLTEEIHVFNPKSVITAIMKHKCSNYWSKTGTFETIKKYIVMNYDGLKDDVINLLAGNKVSVSVDFFQNDMNAVYSKDDVWTVLCHLGYLAYDEETKKCWIPNKEIHMEFAAAVRNAGWDNLYKSLDNSRKLLEATLEMDASKVEEMIDLAHDSTISILKYNDENSLSCTISIAYYYARNSYVMVRELPGGKGFADIVFIPRKGVDKPAMIVELKWDKTSDSGIRQIKDKKYYLGLEEYMDNLLLVSISYDKATKKHQCIIEQMPQCM